MSSRFPHLPGETWDAFLRDELTEAAASRVDAHLRECADCHAALAREDASHLFRLLRDEPPPAGAFDGLMDAIEAEIHATPALRTARPTRRAFWLGSAAAAAILALATLGSWRAPTAPGSASRPTSASAQAPLPATAASPADPCPVMVAASLSLTREECAALYGGPIASTEPPQLMLSESLDLRGL
jgi:anti-sigma factor RsiW